MFFNGLLALGCSIIQNAETDASASGLSQLDFRAAGVEQSEPPFEESGGLLCSTPATQPVHHQLDQTNADI